MATVISLPEWPTNCYAQKICVLACHPSLTIRQRGRVVYELIVNEGAARVDYLFRDNEAELSNCFSIHSYRKYKLWGKLEKFDQKLLWKHCESCILRLPLLFTFCNLIKTTVFLSLYSSSFKQSHNTSHNSRFYHENNKGSFHNHESGKNWQRRPWNCKKNTILSICKQYVIWLPDM